MRDGLRDTRGCPGNRRSRCARRTRARPEAVRASGRARAAAAVGRESTSRSVCSSRMQRSFGTIDSAIAGRCVAAASALSSNCSTIACRSLPSTLSGTIGSPVDRGASAVRKLVNGVRRAGRIARAAALRVSGCLRGRGQRLSDDSTVHVAPFAGRAPRCCSGSPTAACDVQIERHAPQRLGAGERLPQPARELRVVGLPELSGRAAAARSRSHRGRRPARHAVRPVRSDCRPRTPRTRGRLARRRPRGRRANTTPSPRVDVATASSTTTRPPRTVAHVAQQHAALRRAQPGHEHLVIAAAEPAGREAARERQLHLRRRRAA